MASLESRIESKIERIPESGCWIWTGSDNGRGYGQMSTGFKKSPIKVHRAIYAIHYGEIPKGKVIRHRCDVSFCVNPHHLEVGTQKDNIRDMVSRGRLNPVILKNLRRGAKHGIGK